MQRRRPSSRRGSPPPKRRNPGRRHDLDDNAYLRRTFAGGDVEAGLAEAHLVVEREFRTNRHAAVPLEGRGCVAFWDTGAAPYRWTHRAIKFTQSKNVVGNRAGRMLALLNVAMYDGIVAA